MRGVSVDGSRLDMQEFRLLAFLVQGATGKAAELSAREAAHGALNCHEDNTNDVCGCRCIEALYEYRCHNRARPRTKPANDRLLHPFVSYSSEESDRGLLGVQSEISRLRGRLYRPVNDSNLQETLCGLWKEAGAAGKRIIMDARRHADHFEASKTEKAAELREADAVHGALNRLAEDMCRVAGRIFRPFISTRELASIAVKYGIRNEYPMNKGSLARRVPAWDNQSLSRLHTATKKITSCARAFSSLHRPSRLKCTTPSPVWMGCTSSSVPNALGQESFREFLEGKELTFHV